MIHIVSLRINKKLITSHRKGRLLLKVIKPSHPMAKDVQRTSSYLTEEEKGPLIRGENKKLDSTADGNSSYRPVFT